ncbi:MAG: phosphatidate cytidylyltransferase [Hyphomicrobiaceae bacterium]
MNFATQTHNTELRTRVFSAVVLGVAALTALWSGTVAFAALCLILALAMCWEWGRAVRGTGYDPGMLLHGGSVISAAALLLFHQPAVALVLLVVGAVATAAVCFAHRGVISGLGVLYVGLPVLALIRLRQDEEYGFFAVLLVLAVVWSHDTFAMLVGRTIGGPKIWPLLTPNKTWAGVAGGLVASSFAGSIFAITIPEANIASLAIIGLVLGLAGFFGDLLESAFKRTYGLKNASNIIPGHGGVMDRLDGVVLAAPVGLAIGLMINYQSPARALIFWF